MPGSNLSICYSGVQRVYRNAVVRFLRERLNRAYPGQASSLLSKTFEKEWGKIKASAEERRQSGELSVPIIDDFDLLGVNHFYNLFDSYYSELRPDPGPQDEKQEKINKQALLQWIKTIKALRDPLSHPSEHDFTFDDSFVLLDCARRVLVRLELIDAAEEIKELTNQLLGQPVVLRPDVEPLEDRLPARESIVVDFVGRQKELEQLWKWLNDPLSRRWLVAGEGGKGKSALAYTFATDVKFSAPKAFQVVLWLSAKRRKFQEGKAKSIDSPDFYDLESALTRILVDYGWVEKTTEPINVKRDLVISLLKNFPALLVVDDIDSLEGVEEDAVEFLTMVAPNTESKVLLTSRRSVLGMGNTTTHVGGFSEADAEKFIYSRCSLLELDPRILTKETVREVMTATERSPLYIEDLLRLFAAMPPNQAIKAWKERYGDESRKYALGRELEILSARAKAVLVAACISEGPASFAQIEAVTGFSGDQLLSAFNELQRLFLIPKPRLIEGEQRYDVNVNTRTLVHSVLGGSDMYRRAEAAHKAVTEKLPIVGRRGVLAIIRQAVLLVRSGKQPDAEALLLNGLERYPNDPELMGFLGWVYKAWKPTRLTDARETFKRAWQLKCRNWEMYKHWVRMELDQMEWTSAVEVAERALKFLPENRYLLFSAGYARDRLAKDLLGRLQNERAMEELAKGKVFLERALKAPEDLQFGERRLNSEIYRALIVNCELRRDVRGLREYFSRWLNEHPDDPYAHSEWSRLSIKFGLMESEAEFA